MRSVWGRLTAKQAIETRKLLINVRRPLTTRRNNTDKLAAFDFVNEKAYRQYFRKGRVFRTLWPEPAGSSSESRSDVRITTTSFGEQVVEKIRWFIVVQSWKSHCIAVPVHTYNRQGLTKPGLYNPEDHAALTLYDTNAEPLPGEV